MACIRDAKPEIETITMTYDSVEVYTDPGTGGTLTITKSGSHAFTRKWLAEFAGKFLNEDGTWINGPKLSRCQEDVVLNQFYATEAGALVIQPGEFALVAPACCKCRITLCANATAYNISNGIETTYAGGYLGEPDGTTYSDLPLTLLNARIGQFCKSGLPYRIATTGSPTTATWTIATAVTGSSIADAEQTVIMDQDGIVSGTKRFSWTSPDGDVHRFLYSPAFASAPAAPSTQQSGTAVLETVNGTAATSAQATHFLITAETGAGGGFGSFRIGFVGKFARQPVALLTPISGDVVNVYSRAAQLDDTVNGITVSRCMSDNGESWEQDLALTSTDYTRTGSITYEW